MGVLVGLSISREISVGWPGYLAACTLILGVFRSKRWWAMAIAVIAGCLIGMSRGSQYSSEIARYRDLIGTQHHVMGSVTSDAQPTGKGTTTITLGRIMIDNLTYPGEIYVTVAGSTKQLKRGDRIQLQGMVREGFATYPATMTYASVSNLQRGDDVVRDVREWFSQTVRRHVLEPMASLGLGFVVGQRSTLPDSLDEQLKVVGLTHIVVASGYNLTILVRFTMRLLSRHSRYLSLLGSLSLMTLFTMFSGFSPSMNRAVIVTSLGLLAWYVGRRFHPAFLLMYVAAGTALAHPTYLWADLGWYLSFFAFAGVLILAPLVVAGIYKKRTPTSVELLVIETLSAEVMALPLIALAFGTIPVFGLVANVLVAPVIPFAMLATALGGAIAMVMPILGIALFPAMIVIAYVIAIVEWLSSIPWAQLIIELPLWLVVAWYALIASVCLMLWRKSGYDFRRLDRTSDI